MLCSECENARFPSLPTPGNAKGKKRDSNREEKSTKTQTDSDIEQANLDCDTEELRDTVRKLWNDIVSLYEIVTALQNEIAELKLKLSC